jgi:hypothetical protein
MKHEYMTNMGEIILTRENGSTQREACPWSTSYIANPTWTNVGWNTDIPGERPASESWHGLTSDSLRDLQVV